MQVYGTAIQFAQEAFLEQSHPGPQCGRGADELFWMSVADAEAAWDAGAGRVGFLTVCLHCKLQVDFLIDAELTELQAAQWRECRTLG